MSQIANKWTPSESRAVSQFPLVERAASDF